MDQKKNMVRVVDNSEPRKDFEEKRYLICIEYTHGEKDWQIVIGRTAAYELIKDIAEIINYDESFVLVETLKLNERRSIYAFMKYIQNNYEDGFDIDDYVSEEIDEEEFINNSNQEDPEYVQQITQSNRLNMQDVIDGGVQTTPLN